MESSRDRRDVQGFASGRRGNSYDVRPANGSFTGIIPEGKRVVSRVIYNTDPASNTVWIGFNDPGSGVKLGQWEGSFSLAPGASTPIFECGNQMWWRCAVDPLAAIVRLTVVEEYEL